MSDRVRFQGPKYRLHKPTGLAVVRLTGRGCAGVLPDG